MFKQQVNANQNPIKKNTKKNNNPNNENKESNKQKNDTNKQYNDSSKQFKSSRGNVPLKNIKFKKILNKDFYQKRVPKMIAEKTSNFFNRLSQVTGREVEKILKIFGIKDINQATPTDTLH